MVKVKICGITNTEDAIVAQEAGADFLGFIFADSPRRVNAEAAAEIISNLPKRIKTVALFVNEEREKVDKVIKTAGRIDCLQFHGDESAQYCGSFPDKKIIKAFRIKDESSLEKIAGYKDIDFILLDAFKEGQHGGTGNTFDWELANKAKEFNKPLFLSGGLTPDNVEEAIRTARPFCVDVSSGVEKSPGIKDIDLVHKFVAIAKSV
ncbi:MAG: phosphoribosylanthranilate isomerase [Candidatus Omnitrophica bacterium]|nr:phosphoribosylanthranilate isomerase [Candidatus Omnitrophota bacterium]